MVVNGIDTKDISVVVQGAIDREITPLCLESIRKHLPGSEIILSTWKGSKVDGLDYDQLLLNDDPGGYDVMNVEYSEQGNVNRQLYSTLQGIRTVKNPYTVKMRTDFVLRSAGFLKWFHKYSVKNPTYTYFSNKVICCDIVSRNPRYKYKLSSLRYVLHPADFFFFGYTADIMDLFDIPLMTKKEMVWFADIEEEATVLHNFPPEEYVWVKFLQKHLKSTDILPTSSKEITPELIKLTEATFASNLILLSHQQIGIRCAKSGLITKIVRFSGNCFTHRDWLALYKWYCNKLPMQYFLYLFKFFFVNSYGKFVKLMSQISLFRLAKWKLNNFMQTWLQSLKGNLTNKEKDLLRPLYLYAKRVQRRLPKMSSRKKDYAVSYFLEDVTAENLSVVVQGPVTAETSKCLKSIRRYLPQAELILSTWEGSNTDTLDYDLLILNKDPGPSGLIRRYPHLQIHNVNRIIVSSSAGLQRASRRYCLKLRSDVQITSAQFLEYYNKFSKYIGLDSIVSRRVMVDGLSTSKDFPFEVSDWWCLGLTQDIKQIFNVPLYSKKDINYFETEDHRTEKPVHGDLICRYTPEQYIMYTFIKKHRDFAIRALHFANAYDNRSENVAFYQKFIADNLLCLEPEATGIQLVKAQNIVHPFSYSANIPGGTWLDICHLHGSIPTSMHERVLTRRRNTYQKEFLSQPRFYSFENYNTIVKNYASLKGKTHYAEQDYTIEQSEITFVVSGKIALSGTFNAHRCLESIRRFFPKSTIILSTWRGEPIEGLQGLYDQLILLPEPPIPCDVYTEAGPIKKPNTLNNQAYSVHEAMCAVQTKYAVRLRTDFYLTSGRFLSFYIKWAKTLSHKESPYEVFKHRVLVSRNFVADPRLCGSHASFFLSDCFNFGLTEDLLLLWDGHQEPLERLAYFTRHKCTKLENPYHYNPLYTAEQQFFLNVLKKLKPDIHYPSYYFDKSDDSYTFESEKVYASNVVIGSNRQLGIASHFDDNNYPGNYTLERLLEVYLLNVDPSNQQCLDYLQDLYRPQEKKKNWKNSALLLPFWLLLLCVKNTLLTVYRGGKAALRVLLPGYRTACGVRDRQIAQEQVEQTRYDHLVDRINQLEQALAQKDAQLKTAEHKRRPKRDR